MAKDEWSVRVFTNRLTSFGRLVSLLDMLFTGDTGIMHSRSLVIVISSLVLGVLLLVGGGA